MSANKERLEAILRERGIARQAKLAQWEYFEVHGEPGWRYPTFDATGRYCAAMRWKAANGQSKHKYLWLSGNESDRPTFYLLPGTLQAIAGADGLLHIATGEVDVLTLRSAHITNCLSWYGEMNVPQALTDALKALGVKKAIYYPDLDEPGLQAALKVVHRLAEGDIPLEVRLLPGRLIAKRGETGFDLNALWQSCRFDEGTFRAALDSAEAKTEQQLRDILAIIAREAKPAPIPDQVEEVERRVRAEIARRLVKRGDRPDVYECPMPHGPEGKDFYFSLEGPIGGCQGKHAGQLTRWRDLAEYLNIDVSAIARQVHQEAKAAESTNHKKPPQQQKGRVAVVSATDAMAHVLRLTTGEETIQAQPFPAPYKPLRRFGGLVGMWQPRMLIYVIGPSGMGKTAFLETTQDGLRQMGLDFLMWGPEWSPDMYAMRLIAAYGGPTVNEQRLDHLWRKEETLGIPADKRHGKPLTEDQRKLAISVAQRTLQWPGNGYYLDAAGISFDHLLEEADRKLFELRVGQGRRVVAFYLDYIQKIKRGGDNWAELEITLGRFWQFCVDNDLVGIVASQVNKGTAARVRRGELLDEAAGQALSDQQGNVVITLNPVWVDGQRKEEGVIRVVKHSLGPAPVRIKVNTRLNRHRWGEMVLADVEKDRLDDELAAEERPVNLVPWLD